MIRFLLRELEKTPNPIFSKRELLSISKEGFRDLRKRKILVWDRPSSGDLNRLRLPRCQHGCSLTVVEVDDHLEAVCLDHPGEDPVPVEKDDLSRYVFSVDMLLVQLRTANRIEGDLRRISGGFFYVGHKTFDSCRVGIVFVPNIGDQDLVKMSGLRHLCEDDDILVVLTPSSNLGDIQLKRQLHHDKIIHIALADSVNPQTFELPIEELASKVVKSISITELTDKQVADCRKYEYQCRDKIHIPGITPMKRTNEIEFNAHRIRLGDSLFLLFLRLVVELKRKKGGWVDRHTLKSEGVVSDADTFQVYSRLRTALVGSLLEKDGRAFIQNDGSKRYRISTYPDFITYDKKKLRKHPDGRVRKVAGKLPRCRLLRP